MVCARLGICLETAQDSNTMNEELLTKYKVRVSKADQAYLDTTQCRTVSAASPPVKSPREHVRTKRNAEPSPCLRCSCTPHRSVVREVTTPCSCSYWRLFMWLVYSRMAWLVSICVCYRYMREYRTEADTYIPHTVPILDAHRVDAVHLHVGFSMQQL